MNLKENVVDKALTWIWKKKIGQEQQVLLHSIIMVCLIYTIWIQLNDLTAFSLILRVPGGRELLPFDWGVVAHICFSELVHNYFSAYDSYRIACLALRHYLNQH